jgi:hypothetical protein
MSEFPEMPDDDADFTPDLARKIIAKYQAMLCAAQATPEPAWQYLPEIPDDDADFTPDLARKIIAIHQTMLCAAQTPFHPDSNLPDCMMPDGGECCAGHAALCDDWHKQRRRIRELESAAQAAPMRWHLASMNDGLFIINAPPRPSNDDIWPDRKDGPSIVLNVTELPADKARKIVDAMNAQVTIKGNARQGGRGSAPIGRFKLPSHEA